MFLSAIGDPEVRRLARQLDGITGNGGSKAFPKRPEKPLKLGSPSSSITAKQPIHAEVRTVDAPFGVVVTQLQDMDTAPRGHTPAATSCGEFDVWMETRHGPKSGDIVSNLLRFMSEISPAPSPRSPAATMHRNGVANSATGTLLPFSTGWGALHPSVEIRQRPAVLRNTQSDRNDEVRVPKRSTGRQGHYFVRKNNAHAIFPRMSQETILRTRRDFPEIKLRSSVTVPPVPLELFRAHGKPALNPRFRSDVFINTEWHLQHTQITSPPCTYSNNDPFSSLLSHSNQAANISIPRALDEINLNHLEDSYMMDDPVIQNSRASPAQFAAQDAIHMYEQEEEEKDVAFPPIVGTNSDGNVAREPTAAVDDALDQDGHYADEYGSRSVLPVIRNASPLPCATVSELPHKGSSQATIQLAKVTIGIPMSKSGHNIALNRWMQSHAVVAEQYARSKQVRTGPSDIPPPLERISPTSFRKSLVKAPPSRVYSPDLKPEGNVETAIRIIPALCTNTPVGVSPSKSFGATQRSHHVRKPSAERKNVESTADVLQCDSAASSPSDRSRSTPSPPPLPVMRLGGIVSGSKNVFVAEKSEQVVGKDPFGRKNVFSK